MAAAEERVLAFICKHVPEPGLACLAGSTVHTDLAFLRKDMPRIAAHLDYRCVREGGAPVPCAHVESLGPLTMNEQDAKPHGRAAASWT